MMSLKNNQSKLASQSIDSRFTAWADHFLHSPIAFDGKTATEIINLDLGESKQIFNRELSKRKAQEEMKTFITKDGLELKYWLVRKPGNKQVKILLHGSGSNFAKAERAVYLLDRGFDVAMLSYRGHSSNPGKADSKSIKRDVYEAIKDIIALGYDMEAIHFEGSSLGTSILAHVINRFSQEKDFQKHFGSLILKAAPLNLLNADEFTIQSMKKFYLDFEQAKPLLKKLWNQEEAYSRIKVKEIKIVHGAKDDIVPVEHAYQIKKMLEKNNNNISIETIEGEGHRLDLSIYGIY